MNKDIFKKRIRKIVEASCGKNRVREMDYEQEDEDPAELARFDALNNSKDEMLYRDNPIYREAYDEMSMRESKRRIRKIVQEANMDGTISADEEELGEELMAEALIELDNIIAMVREEAMRIGGEFRGPGLKIRIFMEMRDMIGKAR